MRKENTILVILGFVSLSLSAQTVKFRSLDELIDPKETAWKEIHGWANEAKNTVEILPKNNANAKKALYDAQVSTRSAMGAVIYETGGILIDNGWLRILGGQNSEESKCYSSMGMSFGYKGFNGNGGGEL